MNIGIRAVRLRLKKYALLDQVTDICSQRKVPVDEVLGDSHRAIVARVRHEVWASLHVGGLSLCEIGRLFGRHHTTILEAVRQHARRTGVPYGIQAFAG